jgi:ectoine hydroxylase-related dioxygenase (phytanoyl-CoA dioxygenase family)
MPFFKFEDWMVNHYWSNGYMVLRQILPGSLLRDLRKSADAARQLAYKVRGAQTQRIQPLVNYADDLDLQPFHDYCELPELVDAIHKLMGPEYRHHNMERMGLLVSPSEHSWNQGWHRDAVVEVPHAAQNDEEFVSTLEGAWHDRRLFNQVNCAIYNDSSTWYVPGAHARRRDLPGERQTIGFPDLPKWEDYESEAEFEQACYLHCATFPGAQQMHLIAGDYMLYRSHSWHCGNYLSYQPRATIHDSCVYGEGDFVNEYRDRWAQVKENAKARLAAKQ